MDTFVGQRDFPATAARLFAAISDPQALAKWWGPEGFSCDFKKFDFRENGEWIFDMVDSNGTIYPNQNRFLEITEPHKVVIRHEEAPLFTVTLNIQTKNQGSLLIFEQKLDDPDILEKILPIITKANEQLFDKLEQLLA